MKMIIVPLGFAVIVMIVVVAVLVTAILSKDRNREYTGLDIFEDNPEEREEE